MVRSRTRFLEEVDEAKASVAEAMKIAVTITETSWLQNMYLKEKMKKMNFQINSYQNRA